MYLVAGMDLGPLGAVFGACADIVIPAAGRQAALFEYSSFFFFHISLGHMVPTVVQSHQVLTHYSRETLHGRSWQCLNTFTHSSQIGPKSPGCSHHVNHMYRNFLVRNRNTVDFMLV